MQSSAPNGALRPLIRLELPHDVDAIRILTATAFRRPTPDRRTIEHLIVDRLREAGALTISLVAVGADDDLIGHVAFSPMTINRQPGDWYALGPISVAPPVQGRGVGSALVREGLERLQTLGAEACMLLGNPAYYGRFGFVSDERLTHQGEPNRFFQRLVLKGEPPIGDGGFHPAFSVS